jgi:hypothetical protein
MGSVAPWPSWSWLAWKGRIDIPNEPRYNSYDPSDDIEPSNGVRSYILELDGEDEMTLRVVNENGGWRFHEGYVKRGGGIFDLAWYHQPRWTSSKKSQDDSEEDKVSEHYEAVDPFIVAQVGRG